MNDFLFEGHGFELYGSREFFSICELDINLELGCIVASAIDCLTNLFKIILCNQLRLEQTIENKNLWKAQ